MLRRILMMMVLALGVGTVANATKIFADLSAAQAVGHSSWNAETNTFTWTANSWASMVLPGLYGDLSDCTELVLETENLQNNSGSDGSPATFRIDIFLNDGTQLIGYNFGMVWSEAGILTVDLQKTFQKEQLSQVKEIKINTNSAAGSVVLKRAYITKPFSLTFDESGKAYILPSDMANLANGVTIDEQTGEITKSEEGDASITLNLEDVDFSNVTSISFDYNNTSTNGYSDILSGTEVVDIAGERINEWTYTKYNIDYTDVYRARGHVSKIVLHFAGDGTNVAETGKMIISSICITKSVITASDMLNLTKDDYKNWTAFDETAQPTSNGAGVFEMNLGTLLGDGGMVYGDLSVNGYNYADITGADYLKVVGTVGTQVRLLLNRQSESGSDYIQVIQPIDENGTVLFDLSSYDYVHLNAVKIINGSGIIDAIGLINEGGVDYYIAGAGDMVTSAESALADASATRIDVTGLTNNEPITLTSANPNCLFIASDAAKLTNTTNVLVAGEEGGYECANLSLDAAYPFKAPFDFAATTATVKKSVTEIGFATFVSPYSAAVPDGCKAYKIVSVDEADVLQCEPVEQIVANEPVLLVGEGTHQFAASGVNVSVAPQTLVSDLLNGSYEATTAPANSYVLQNQSGVTAFYRVAEDGKQQVVPFTAYLTLPAAGANVRMLSIDLGSDATAIENVPSSVATVVAVYDLSGRSVEGLQRGINLVKMSDGTVKKVVVK